MSTPKPILFVDFDGTLCHDRFWRSLPPEIFEKIQVLLFVGNKKMVNDWMVGLYTSEDVNRFLAENLSFNYSELWNVFVKDCSMMSVSENIFGKIESLRKKYKTVLITDNMDCFTRFTAPALNLQKYFDVIINSWDIKNMKTENGGQFFLAEIKEHQADIRHCILIDNSQKACKFFESLGGKAFLVSPDRDINSLLTKVQGMKNVATLV